MNARLFRRLPELPLLCALAGVCALSPLITFSPDLAGSPSFGVPDPNWIDLSAILQPPSRRHWLGTDSLGRDLLARLLHGGRASLAIASGAALASLCLGALAGLGSGLAGGWPDLWGTRLMEASDCLPTLIVALAAVATGYGRGALPLVIIITATRWTQVARVARAEALRWRATPRWEAAQASGAGALRMLVRHLLPAELPLLATASALVAAEALVVEAGLGLVGFGVDPPHPTWGNLLMEARRTLDEAWWLAAFPGLAIFLSLVAFLGLAERAGLRAGQLRERAGEEAPEAGR